MAIAQMINAFGTGCGYGVHNDRSFPRTETTVVEGVGAQAFPVETAPVVYAGKLMVYPQSTGLITAITSTYTGDTYNHFAHSRKTTP